MAVTGKKTAKTEAAPARTLRIRLVRSLIGYPREQREVAKGLGLRKLNSEVVRTDTPQIRGMIRKIVHLLDVKSGEGR
jgi:large subunit ribosomal protein L30